MSKRGYEYRRLTPIVGRRYPDHHVCMRAMKAGKKLPHDCGKDGQLRRLFPRELEAMNGFSEAHSQACEQLKISDGRRAFFMGNALVVGVVERILKALVS